MVVEFWVGLFVFLGHICIMHFVGKHWAFRNGAWELGFGCFFVFSFLFFPFDIQLSFSLFFVTDTELASRTML